MTTTTSTVLFSGNTAEPERELLRKWADHAAANGGSFSINQSWTNNNWYATYVINWPESTPVMPLASKPGWHVVNGNEVHNADSSLQIRCSADTSVERMVSSSALADLVSQALRAFETGVTP